MIDRSGRIHYRKAGIATHIGLIFDISAVGVAKNLLCGEPINDLDQKLPEEERIPKFSDSSMNLETDETVGYAYQSRQYSSPNRSINPLYVSPGHRVSEEESVKLTAELCKGYKLPEPIRIADKHVGRIKTDFQD